MIPLTFLATLAELLRRQLLPLVTVHAVCGAQVWFTYVFNHHPLVHGELFMKIAILGAGNVGGALGKLWSSQGHDIVFGVRDPQSAKVEAALAQIGATVPVTSVAEAVAFGDLVLLAVPWQAVPSVLKEAGDWKGKILLDATNRLATGGPGQMPSAGEDVARWAQGARVVKGFNTTGSGNMDGRLYGPHKVDILICGDDARAKATVSALIEASGFDVVDAGPLANAGLMEAMAGLWVQLAYRLGNGPNIMFKLHKR